MKGRAARKSPSHRPFSKRLSVYLLLDLTMAAATDMTASNWRIQHIEGHHRDREDALRGVGHKKIDPL